MTAPPLARQRVGGDTDRPPRNWAWVVRCWQDPKLKMSSEQVLILIDPTPEQEDRGVRGWCLNCVELALISGGAWTDHRAYATASGHPERISQFCDTCSYKSCADHVEDHGEDTGHHYHDAELEETP